MDSIDLLDVIKKVEKKINEIQPSIIFTHFPNDLNIDHRITADAVITAIRPIPGQTVKEIYFFEVPSSTDYQIYLSNNSFQPNLYYSITDSQMLKKKKSLEAYKTEMREYPHSRSIEAVEALAKVRGVSVGFDFAEAFVVGRIIR
jgi:LmbE family N-acetylglucosaminyl deacetylase